MEKIEKKKGKMLAEYRKPEIPESIVSSIHSYLTDRGIDPKLMDR